MCSLHFGHPQRHSTSACLPQPSASQRGIAAVALCRGLPSRCARIALRLYSVIGPQTLETGHQEPSATRIFHRIARSPKTCSPHEYDWFLVFADWRGAKLYVPSGTFCQVFQGKEYRSMREGTTRIHPRAAGKEIRDRAVIYPQSIGVSTDFRTKSTVRNCRTPFCRFFTLTPNRLPILTHGTFSRRIPIARFTSYAVGG